MNYHTENNWFNYKKKLNKKLSYKHKRLMIRFLLTKFNKHHRIYFLFYQINKIVYF